MYPGTHHMATYTAVQHRALGDTLHDITQVVNISYSATHHIIMYPDVSCTAPGNT